MAPSPDARSVSIPRRSPSPATPPTPPTPAPSAGAQSWATLHDDNERVAGRHEDAAERLALPDAQGVVPGRMKASTPPHVVAVSQRRAVAREPAQCHDDQRGH